MSTSFEIYPRKRLEASIADVMATTSLRLATFYRDFGLQPDPVVVCQYSDDEAGAEHDYVTERFEPPLDGYAVMRFRSGEGYLFANRDIPDPEYVNYEVTRLRKESSEVADHLLYCLSLGESWRCDRSASAAAEVSLGYGYLAAVIAEFTDGIIFSDDAWDTHLFPCRPCSIYDEYMRPEKAVSEGYRNWANRIITSIRLGYEPSNMP